MEIPPRRPHMRLMTDEISMPVEGITEEHLRALIPLFYARVRKDPVIGPVFNDAIHDWSEHLDRLVDFWSSVMLTSGRYKGRPLPAHVKHGDRITARSFERWLRLWHETTEEMLPPAAAGAMQYKAARIAESLSLGISFARGEGLTAAAARPA